jgi:hypothetical protein
MDSGFGSRNGNTRPIQRQFIPRPRTATHSLAKHPLALTLSVNFLILASANLAHAQSDPDALEAFEKRIRPLLVEKCSECHSIHSELNGGLSIDSTAAIKQGGDSGPAIDPVTPENSLLLRAIEYRDPKLQMPPDGKLQSLEIELLKTWISNGMIASPDFEKPLSELQQQIKAKPANEPLSVAQARSHWAYTPIQRKITLHNDSQTQRQNLIDAKLHAKQQSLGIEPNHLVDNETWLRRLVIDLHGLNPTYDFLQQSKKRLEDISNSTDGNEEQIQNERLEIVDELLSSPRYGERLARHWMDVVRYAESLTLRGFILNDVWRYRNYLIRSFHQDKSFRDIVMEQVAGDLLNASEFPNGSNPNEWTAEQLQRAQDRLTATTFLAIGDHNYEEQDKKQLEMDAIDEQLDVLGKAFLGQTLSCARCHDHKFDPIPTADYYALAGILKSSVAMDHENVSKWIRIPLPVSAEKHQELAQTAEQLKSVKEQIAKLKESNKGKSAQSNVVAIEELAGVIVDNTTAKKVGDWEDSSSVANYVGKGYVHDRNQDKGAKSVTFEPANLQTGKYIVRIAYAPGENRSSKTAVRVFSADGDQLFTINQKKPPSDDGLWNTLGTFQFESGGQAFVIISNEGTDGHVIADAVQFLPESNSTTILSQPSPNSSKDNQELNKSKLASLEKEQIKLQAIMDTRPMVQSVRIGDSPSDIPIHVRGSVHRLGKSVPRGFLSCINAHEPELAQRIQIPPDANGRLELAQWLVAPENPLTPRVYVNRIWTALMGHGIVRSVDNFGTTGTPPSDPELLDALCTGFIENNWSTKWLVRTIVTSDAYRRSIKPTSTAMELDPENLYFSHSHLRRLDAESLRDSILQASGELVDAHYAAPDGNESDSNNTQAPTQSITSTIKNGPKEDYRYQHSVGLRSIYLPWFRNALPELIREFDGANPSFSISERSRSTVATQALALMNSPWVADRASAITKLLPTDTDENERIQTLFRQILHRDPTPAEHSWAQTVLKEATDQELAHQLLASIDFRYAP